MFFGFVSRERKGEEKHLTETRRDGDHGRRREKRASRGDAKAQRAQRGKGRREDKSEILVFSVKLRGLRVSVRELGRGVLTEASVTAP